MYPSAVGRGGTGPRRVGFFPQRSGIGRRHVEDEGAGGGSGDWENGKQSSEDPMIGSQGARYDSAQHEDFEQVGGGSGDGSGNENGAWNARGDGAWQGRWIEGASIPRRGAPRYPFSMFSARAEGLLRRGRGRGGSGSRR